MVQKISLKDQDYPRLLKEIQNPPETIYVRGSLKPEDLCFAVVGTRKPSAYGVEATKYFTRGLSEAGFTIVAGLALGVDAIAHQEALNCGKRTIAVLGSGVDQLTPITNQRLGEKIIENGAVISEFPIGMPAMPHHFPQRDRIMSGLSYGVLVIEAREKSGALITARSALEQGREVFGVPGEIFSLSSKGVNKLIQEGAKLVSSVEDIVEEFQNLPEVYEKVSGQTSLFALPENEKLIFEVLDNAKTSEEIVLKTNLSSGEVNSLLTMLELKDLVKRRPDGRFIRAK